MDKKLSRCIASLRQEAAGCRAGFVGDYKPLVEDVRDLCTQMSSPKDVAVACALIFDEQDGVFGAVGSLATVRDREAQKGREAILDFVADFIREMGDCCLPYASQITDNSLRIFKRDESKSVQACALNLLIALFELGVLKAGISDIMLDYEFAQPLLKEFWRAKTSNTLKCNILIVLGYSVEFFPQSFTEENVGEILRLCLDIFEDLKKKDPAHILISGATKCLDSLLTWFEDGLPAGGSVENSKRIFSYLQQLLYVRNDLKRYEIVKAGLNLLSRHARLFRLRLLEHSMVFLKWLQTYCQHINAGLREAAILAFDKFLSEIGSCLACGDERIKNPQMTYRSLMKDTLEILDSQDSHHKLVAVTIRALGNLSPAIVKFSGIDSLKQTFHRLIPFTSRASEEREESLGYSVTLVESFADIIVQLNDVEDFMLSLVAEVTGHIFYQFPNLFQKQKQAVYSSLQSLFRALYAKGAVFNLFLSNIVWSSLQRATEPSAAIATEVDDQLWRDYVDLWLNVLDVTSVETLHEVEEDAEDDAEKLAFQGTDGAVSKDNGLQELIFDTVMRCIMKSMVELNIKYRVRHQPSTGEPDEPETGTFEPEMQLDLIEPLDSVQMQKYLNLVEFTQELLSRCNSRLFLKWTYPFGQGLIELSSCYPLVSGFYKLLAMAVTVADKENYFASPPEIGSYIKWNISPEDHQLCKDLLRKYLQEVSVASRRYKLELLASCLCLCLLAPPDLIRISSLVGPLKNALSIGLRYNPLAVIAVDALERWQLLRPSEIEEYLDKIVPCLSDYLVEVEASELSDGVNTVWQQDSARRRTKLSQLVKHSAYSRIQPEPFQLTQVRVQQFLGRIGRFGHHLVSNVDLLQVASGISWDSGDRVRFILPFPDVKPDIWLDTLLPRLVELGLSSYDRRTKVAACELLHAISLLMLGTAAKGPLQRIRGDSDRVQYDKIYRRLFPAILRLATDVDLVNRQIFREFTHQLIHWFTSNQNKENPDTMALLDSILDGLVQSENGSLREFCAECFAEFLEWSVRHVPVEVDNFVNVTTILRRLYSRLDHPNAYHRLGAAMAVHHIYPVLRQNSSIVDQHVLQLSFYSIKSLRLAENDADQLGTVKQLKRTLGYLEKLIKLRLPSLQNKRKDRLMFQTIEDFLQWLFLETGRTSEESRIKCMSMFCSICESLSDGSAAGWFLSEIESGRHHGTMMKSFDTGQTCQAGETVQLNVWLSSLARSLHWFTWALKQKLIGLETLGNMQFICEMQRFLEDVFSGKVMHDDSLALTPAERGNHVKLKLSSLMYFLKFCTEVFKLGSSDSGTGKNIASIVPATDPRFHSFMGLLLVQPRSTGFAISDSHASEELANCLFNVMTYGPSAMKAGVSNFLSNYLDERMVPNLFDFSLALEEAGNDGRGLADIKHLLKGLQIMHRAGILIAIMDKKKARQRGEQLMTAVFKLERECPPSLEPVALDMLMVSNVLGVEIQKLMQLVLDEKPVQSSSVSSNRKLTAGNIFYMNFRKVIIQQVKFGYDVSLPILLKSAISNFTARLLLNSLLDSFLTSTESVTRDSFLNCFLKWIHYLEPCCSLSAGLPEKRFFLEIVQRLMLLDKDHDMVLRDLEPSSRFLKDAFCSLLTLSQHGGDGAENSLTLNRDALQTLKSDCLILVPLFFAYPLDLSFRTYLASCLTKIVSDFLLVSEKDITALSYQRTRYIDLLEKLLHVISSSKSLELLDVTFPLLQYPTKLSAKRLSRAIHMFGESIDEKQSAAALDLCYATVKDAQQTPTLRRAMAEVVFPPLVKTSAPQVILSWYVEHIQSLIGMFSKANMTISAEQEGEELVTRICHYKIVELMFLTLEVQVLKDAITPLVPNSQLMKLANDDARAKNDPSTYAFEENVSLWRDLHISAYCCLAAVISRTQEQEKFFTVFLFKEGGNAGFIWQHLVDCNKVYDNFPVETTSYRAALEAVKELQAKGKSEKTYANSLLATLSSQYIIGSTLSQEPSVIGSFITSASRTNDVEHSSTFAVLGDADGQKRSDNSVEINTEGIKEEEVFDDDDFDKHPCMGVVLSLIDHLQTKFGSHKSEQMSEWMKAMYSSLSFPTTHINVRLFIVKIITKLGRVFAPYAEHFFRPYAMAVLSEPSRSGAGGTRFHYLLRQVCVCILQWNLHSPPDAVVGSNLINHLMTVAVDNSKPVLKANISIIRLFLGAWKDYIQVDTSIVFNHIVAGGRTVTFSDKSNLIRRSVGLQLVGAFVASGLPLFDRNHAVAYKEAELYKALLLNLEINVKDIYEASAELLGMLLAQRHDANLDKDDQVLEAPLKKMLLSLFKDSAYDRFLNILNKITSRFAVFLDSYVSLVIDLLPRLQGVFKTIALDILLHSPASFRALSSTMVPLIPKLFIHRDESTQLKSLLLLSAMLDEVDTRVLSERVLPALCETFSTHENLDCRRSFYDVLILLYDSKGMKDDKLVLHHLLRGLCEMSDTIRDVIRNFWHSNLSTDLIQRFSQMINEMYDPDLEEQWAQYTSALLLQLCKKSVDYGRPIFDAPLSDCEFHEQTINDSWLGGSLPMTPLFSGTQTFLDSSQDYHSVDKNVAIVRQPGMIRGTVLSSFSLSMSQTQGAASMERLPGSESSLYALSQRSAGDVEDQKGMVDQTGSLKRIYHPSVIRASAVRGRQNANRRREARRAQQALERSNKIQIMRHYRSGELPDIQIKNEEVIALLASLAGKDTTFSRLLLTVLVKGMLSLSSHRLQGKEDDLTVFFKTGVENALARTHFGISFVGCLESLCIQDPAIWINPKLVGCASSKSNNLHSGILLLENQLCHDMLSLPATNSKRHKGRSGHVSPASTSHEQAWIELAQLYEGIQEADIVLAIYQKHVAKQTRTKQALQVQLAGDHSRALALYDECLDQLENVNDDPPMVWSGGQISETEVEIWDRQRRSCLMEMNCWKTLVDETLLEIGNETFDDQSIDKLWDPKYKDPYLSLFVKGAAKLTTYHSLLMKFVQRSMNDPSRAAFLLEEFGSQLLHLAVANDQFDRAWIYLGECYKNFRKHWTALHPLATGSRHLQMQQLQKIVEHEEFLDFIKNTQESNLRRLLLKWKTRWPSTQVSGVETWGDIVNSRILFFNKMQSVINKRVGENSKRVSGQPTMMLASQLDAERAHLFCQAARGLIKLGAYGVAKGFTQDCQAMKTKVVGKDEYDYLSFKGLVKLQILQADRLQEVNANEAVELRKKVLHYIRHTSKSEDVQRNEAWWMGVRMAEASVSSQVGWSLLELLPTSHVAASALKDGLAGLGSAFALYQTVTAELQDARKACYSPLRAAKALHKFGSFCDELLKASKDSRWGKQAQEAFERGNEVTGLPPAAEYPCLIVEIWGKALSLNNSLPAHQSVARLLSLLNQHPHIQHKFQSISEAIPRWYFIHWIPQMLATVDDEVGGVVVKLLEDIAKLYPQALYHPFQVSRSDFGAVGRRRTERLELYLRHPVLASLARALEDLAFPEQRLQDGLLQIKLCLATGDKIKAQEMFSNVFADAVDLHDMKKQTRLAGDYNLKFAEEYARHVVTAFGDDGAKLRTMDEAGFSVVTKQLVSNLNKSLRMLPAGSHSVASFSRWMAEFDQMDEVGKPGNKFSIRPDEQRRLIIEIPGQYAGFHQPHPEAHIKLVGFEPTVFTLSSKQRPKILTMRGSDEKDYKFVVKGGEDLRLDQRIEQLFEVMNHVLRRDSACSRRMLSVPTFAVVPVSRRCGLLQFVENTRVLQDVVKDGFSSAHDGYQQTKAADILFQNLSKQYVDWMCEKAPAENLVASYHKSYTQIDQRQVVEKMAALEAQVPWDAFRKGMSRLSTSAEAYLLIRSQFARSLAVVSIFGYVAGVGDRHLGNMLVDIQKGSLVPIDFGYSFGTAVILLPVPELVPFRLTRQLLNCLLPLDTAELLRNDMVRAMSALHASRDVVGAVLDIFVKEPLVDWKAEATRASSLRKPAAGHFVMEAVELGADGQVSTSHEQKQHVKLKIELAHHKLDLWNPAEVTISELHSSIHANKPYLQALQDIVLGSHGKNGPARATKQRFESVHDQVDCLINQATNPNLYGRTWIGWQPWI